MKTYATVFLVILLLSMLQMGLYASSAGNKAIELYPFSDTNWKWGYMNKKGEVIIKPQFDFADYFNDGYARVASITGERYKWGYINKNGEFVLPIKYDHASSFKNGNAVVGLLDDPSVSRIEATTFWIDTNGKSFLKTNFDSGRSFYSEGLALVMLAEPQKIAYSFIRKNGEVAFPSKFDVALDFSEGLAAVYNDMKGGYIDTTGKEAIPIKYYNVDNFSEGLAPVAIERTVNTKGKTKTVGEYGFINKVGETIIPFKYEYAYSFRDGRSLIQQNEKWGFIDKTGNIIVSPQYEEARSFNESLAAVKQNGKWGFINKTGKIVIAPQYENVDDCINGMIMIKSSEYDMSKRIFNSLYYIDKQGNKIVPQI